MIVDKATGVWHNLTTMTLQQIAKQLNIPAKKLERESLRVYLLTKLGETEAKRQKILKRYSVESVADWDNKTKEGKVGEGGYRGINDYFTLDYLDFGKAELIKDILSFSYFHLETKSSFSS